MVAADANKKLVSIATLSAWIAGTANRISITDDGDGSITISAPQDLHTGASVIGAIQIVKDAGANLLCLPEMCLTGYGCEDQFFSPFTQQKAQETVQKLLDYSSDLVLLVGLPMTFESRLYNVVAVLYQGKIQAYIPKQHLANEGLHYEARWFTPWPSGVRTVS